MVGPVRIACVGDSITEGACSTDGKTYPAQLQERLGGAYRVQNFGVSGSTLMSSGLWDGRPYAYRDQPAFEAGCLFNPQIVLFMLGGNDSKTENWPRHTAFEEDFRVLIAHYRALPSRPVVVVGTSPAVHIPSFTVTDDIVSGMIAPIQRRLAAELGCILVDINALTHDAPQWYAADGVHLNNEGYGRVAEAFAAVVLQLACAGNRR